MRVNINLASRKYEDVQRFFVRWGVVLVLLAGLTILLGALAAVKFSRVARNEKETREMKQKIAELQRENDSLVAAENLPENREVTQQKKFWNTEITKRSFSWTQLLNDLQKIMPHRAYLDSVQPELTPDNRVELKMTIVGEKYEDALELQKKLEASKCFHQPRILTETPQKETKGPANTFKFEISANYTPECTAQARSTTKEGM